MIKNIVFRSLLGISLLSVLMACNNEEGEKPHNDEIAITRIATGIQTKAADDVWANGDVIGVTMYTPDTVSIINDQFNYPYINRIDGINGSFSPLEGTLFFPQNGDSIRLKAYYPYYTALGADQLLTVNVTDQDSLPAIDLMTGVHLDGFSKTEPDVEMRFYHRMCKLVFQLVPDEENEGIDLSNCDLTIHGMEGGNTYDLHADTFLNLSTGIEPIAVPLRTTEPDSIRTAIVLSRTAGTGVEFAFLTPEGNTYIARMSDQLPLGGGNRYTFRVLLSANPVIVTADIQPWIVNPEEEYEAK